MQYNKVMLLPFTWADPFASAALQMSNAIIIQDINLTEQLGKHRQQQSTLLGELERSQQETKWG